MRYTSNYNLAIAEGTDNVNLLTQSYPNFETIDTALKDVSDSAITGAAETKVGTVHNLVRTSPDRLIIKFTATSNYVTGDTFTVDGVAVTAVTTGGTALKTGAFLINSNVLCILNGLVLTVLVSEVSVDASDVNFDNAGTSMLSTNVQDAIEEVKNAIPLVPASYAATAITYDNSGSGLIATNVQDAIDELSVGGGTSYEEVTAPGNTSYTSVLNTLYGLITPANVTSKSRLEVTYSGRTRILPIIAISASTLTYETTYVSDTGTVVRTEDYRVSSSSKFYQADGSATPVDKSTTNVASGTVIRLYY